jgi:hypothetical protein
METPDFITSQQRLVLIEAMGGALVMIWSHCKACVSAYTKTCSVPPGTSGPETQKDNPSVP